MVRIAKHVKFGMRKGILRAASTDGTPGVAQEAMETRTLDYASPRTAQPMLFVESRDGRLVVTMQKPSPRRVLVATYVPMVVIFITLIGGVGACYMTFALVSGSTAHWLL